MPLSWMQMFGDIIQPTHLLFILVVALIVLGPKRLPEVGRSLGRGLHSFRQGMQGMQDEARTVFNDAIAEPTPPEVRAAATPAAVTPAESQAPQFSAPVVAASAQPNVTQPALATFDADPFDYTD